MNLVEPIDIRTGQPFQGLQKPRAHGSLHCECIGGWSGRARGLTGGAFMGTLLAQQGGGGWVNPYVTDGLVAMWDGQHIDSSAWVDMIGGISIPLTSDTSTIGNNYVDTVLGASLTATTAVSHPSNFQLEFCGNFASAINPRAASLRFGNYGIGPTDNGNIPRMLQIYPTASYPNGQHGYSMIETPGHTDISLSSKFNGATSPTGYINGTSFSCRVYSSGESSSLSNGVLQIGGAGRRVKCYCVRVYNRALTADEVAANYAVDKARFGLT